MPLQDHFHPPLSERRHWQAFHNAWATCLAAELNRGLPAGYFAEPNVQFGIEIDVAAWEETGRRGSLARPASGQGPAPSWSPPAPALTIALPLVEDVVEVAVFKSEAGPDLVGAVELVSPANKDRPEARDAFVAKCKTYLQQGVGLVVVDVVTSRWADLHAALLSSLGGGPEGPAQDSPLQAAAYRPLGKSGQARLEVWRESMGVGRPLPTLPLWLRGGPCLPVPFEATYETACRDLRLLPAKA